MPKATKRTSTRVKGSVTTYHINGTTSTKKHDAHGLQLARGREDTSVRLRSIYQNSSITERQILQHIHEGNDGLGWEVMGDMDGDEGGNDDGLDLWIDEAGDTEAVTRLAEEIYQMTGKRKRIDTRDRRDRTHKRNIAWQLRLPHLVRAFLEWDCDGAPSSTLEDDGHIEPHPALPVHNLLNTSDISLPRHPDEDFTQTLTRHGYLGFSPDHPERAFSFHLLKFFKVLSTRCPQLSAQAFVKSCCELHGVPYHPTLRNNFSDVYDVYVAICGEVEQRMAQALHRNTPDWRLKNACPSCTYKLEGEPALKISMQVTMDGNNTQKRVERTVREVDEEGAIIASTNIERRDERKVCGDYYLTPEEVDKFAHEVKRRLPLVDASDTNIAPSTTTTFEGRPIDGANEPTPCTDKWSNLSDEAVKKMWGIYLETGIFLALCRHGTVLVMCDMLRSGELAKYPLAITNKLIDVLGHDLMNGYDIGCGFSATANNSGLLGEKLRQRRARFCCGSFHGHAHCRLCQLDWHPLYIEGSGLEEYEGCERAFSDSNGTGRRTRYATRFHRQQILTLHFKRWDGDKYAELSRFLLNNYRQAAKNLAILPEQLAAAKHSLGIDSDVRFEEWREAEKAYLQGLKKEPEEDILKMEYLNTLIKLRTAETDFSRLSNEWQITPVEELRRDNYYARAERCTKNIEAGRSQALELLLTLRRALMDLEEKLDIQVTWTPDSEEWHETEKYLNMRTYQRALDTLEGLVVARLFELTKANQSGTGYKLRTHIAKAMKARSQAIRTAIKRYNEAAEKLNPARPTLDPKTVLDYVFLAEFDILRDARNDVRDEPWARAPERLASTTYFKICWSKEEKMRVEVEARRLRTWIHHEAQLFVEVLAGLRVTDPWLAHQVRNLQRSRTLVNDEHIRVLTRLERQPGYAGVRGVGVRMGGMELDRPIESEREGIHTEADEDDGDDDSVTAEAIDSTIEALNRFDD